MTNFPNRSAPSNAKSGSSHLIGWLGNDTQTASVLATARLHLKIRSAVSAALPASMRGAFEVIKIEQNTLTLTVSSAAFAAKFRQIAPRVTAHIQSLGWNTTEIKLRVQGGIGLAPAIKPAREARVLDQQDLKAFEQLNQQLRPGPLADAVSKLLRHHQTSQTDDRQEGIRRVSTRAEMPVEPHAGKNK
jgi:hypothetical protein